MSDTPPVSNTNPQGSVDDQEHQQPISNTETAAAAAAAAAAATSASATHTPADIDKMVASYLQKKGYKATEVIFSRESKGETVPVDDVLTPKATITKQPETIIDTDQVMDEVQVTESAASGDPDVYDVSYKSLREWIENSLDWYKVNVYLESILFSRLC